MRAARFEVSGELLRQALQMPDGSRITHVRMSDSGLSVVVLADDPALPESEVPHDCSPTVTQHKASWDWGVG